MTMQHTQLNQNGIPNEPSYWMCWKCLVRAFEALIKRWYHGPACNKMELISIQTKVRGSGSVELFSFNKEDTRLTDSWLLGHLGLDSHDIFHRLYWTCWIENRLRIMLATIRDDKNLCGVSFLDFLLVLFMSGPSLLIESTNPMILINKKFKNHTQTHNL